MSMDYKTYEILKFLVIYFLEFISKLRNNYYKIKKLVNLKSLQKFDTILNSCSKGSF